jgi:predicted metal-dependent hydrolase
MARGRGQATGDPALPAAAADGVPTGRGAGGHDPMGTLPADVLVEVRRSPRRRRTVSAYRDGDAVVVLLPAGLDAAQEAHWVRTMLARLDGQEQRRRPDDEALAARAAELSRRYLGARAAPSSVRWVDNQETRWGSCTPSDGSIRISRRLRGVPTWVLDYVLLHELAHLLEPGHGTPFWRVLDAYPRTERARGFLEGLEHAQGHRRGGPPEGGDVLPESSG